MSRNELRGWHSVMQVLVMFGAAQDAEHLHRHFRRATHYKFESVWHEFPYSGRSVKLRLFAYVGRAREIMGENSLLDGRGLRLGGDDVGLLPTTQQESRCQAISFGSNTLDDPHNPGSDKMRGQASSGGNRMRGLRPTAPGWPALVPAMCWPPTNPDRCSRLYVSKNVGLYGKAGRPSEDWTIRRLLHPASL